MNIIKKNRIKITKLDLVLKIVNGVLLGLLSLSIILPFWEILMKSFMSDMNIISSKIAWWPKAFQFEGYRTIFTDRVYSFGRAFLNSVIVTVATTVYQLTITSLAAYALTKKTLPGLKFFTFYFLLTMYFGGGLIPYYILIRSLGLMNKLLVMIVPSFISIFNLLVLRTFFSQLPTELFDSARVDGAGNFRVLGVIVLPLSKAVLATIALFIAVGTWNNWFTAMLFIPGDYTKRPVAYALQYIISLSRGLNSEIGGGQVMIGQSVQYAAIIVAIVPIMLIYPFLQKYFTKGVMIGSIKG